MTRIRRRTEGANFSLTSDRSQVSEVCALRQRLNCAIDVQLMVLGSLMPEGRASEALVMRDSSASPSRPAEAGQCEWNRDGLSSGYC